MIIIVYSLDCLRIPLALAYMRQTPSYRQKAEDRPARYDRQVTVSSVGFIVYCSGYDGRLLRSIWMFVSTDYAMLYTGPRVVMTVYHRHLK